jgi:Protein of unknown function (DUF3237)
MTTELHTKHILTMQLETGAPQQVGTTPSGRRLVVPVLGGTFEGERLKGTVEPGGSDWITIRADGAFALDVRLVLKTHDDALIGLTYRGLRHGPVDVIAKLGRGEPVPASEYYFRVAMSFETASETYGWLNRIVAVGTGERLPSGPIYTIFEVL